MFNSQLLRASVVTAIVFFATITTGWSQPLIVFTVGPTLHFNINDDGLKTSFGLEIGLWTMGQKSKVPYGANFGVEFEKTKTRLFAEAQVGLIIGASAGPVFEYDSTPETKKWSLGAQGSAWVSVILGADVRYRFINTKSFITPGVFGKYIHGLPKIQT